MRAFTVVIATLCGCGEHAPSSRGSHPPMAAVAVAQVGDSIVLPETVEQIARAQRVTAATALHEAIDSAIAAEAATKRGLTSAPAARWAIRAIYAERVLEQIRDEARAKGPPRDDEIEALTQRHWRDVDVGDSLRVIHAVALHPKKPDPAVSARAKRLMDRLAVALPKARNAEDFEAIAKSDSEPGVELTVEALAGFQEDGRTVEGQDAVMDPAFAHAAFAVTPPETTSPVVESKFGWHVIRVLERIPGRHLSKDDRRVAFADEAYRERGAGKVTATLRRLREEVPVEVDPAAETLLTEVVELSR